MTTPNDARPETIRLTSTLPHPSEHERPVRFAVVGAALVAVVVGAFMLRTPADAAAPPKAPVAAAHPAAPPPPAPPPAAEPPADPQPAPVATHAPAKKVAPVTTQARVAAPKPKAPALIPATAKKTDTPQPSGDDDIAALANRGAAAPPPPPPAPPPSE